MELNPYESPSTGAERVADAPSRKLSVATCCFGFAAMFAVMFIGTVQKFDGTLGNAVVIGWCFCTSLGCCAMGCGMLFRRRWRAAVGACLVLLALGAMFTVVINYSARLSDRIVGRLATEPGGRLFYKRYAYRRRGNPLATHVNRDAGPVR